MRARWSSRTTSLLDGHRLRGRQAPHPAALHYTHISDDILPALRAAGVTTDQIEQMLVRNPRAIFEGVV